MAEYWRCKKCGRVNLGYVGTCGCGGLKADGTQASEEDYKQEQGFKDIETKTIKKKWQCPNCLKINEGDFCSCGHVKGRDDKYVEESDNPSQVTYTTSRSGSNVKRIALIIAIIFGVIMVGKSVLPMNKGIEGTYISYTNTINNREALRFVLKDNGEYVEYIFKQPVKTGKYTYDKSTNTLELEGWSWTFKYGKDVDGVQYIARPLVNGGYEYYYKRSTQ